MTVPSTISRFITPVAVAIVVIAIIVYISKKDAASPAQHGEAHSHEGGQSHDHDHGDGHTHAH